MDILDEPAREVMGKGWSKEIWMEYWKAYRNVKYRSYKPTGKLTNKEIRQLTENISSADTNFTPP